MGNVFGEAAQLNEPIFWCACSLKNRPSALMAKNCPQSGMVPEADILHENRKIYEWVLEPLYSVAGKIGG